MRNANSCWPDKDKPFPDKNQPWPGGGDNDGNQVPRKGRA